MVSYNNRMIKSVTQSARLIPLTEQKRRLLALATADRHCDIERLPAPTPFALSLDERWVTGQASANQIADALIRYHVHR